MFCGNGFGNRKGWGWGDWGENFGWSWFFDGGFDDGFGFRSVVGDGDGGFAAGWTLINLDPFLVEPELNFVVAVLRLGGEFQDVDFGVAAAVQIADDDVSELGDRAGADVTFDAVSVFVHEEVDVSAVEVFIEAFVEVGKMGGVIVVVRHEPAAKRKARLGLKFAEGLVFGGNWSWPVNDVVATTFKVASPVERALM